VTSVWEQRALVERTDKRRDHVHELDPLPLHVARKQFLRIGREFEEPA
jgi:hypothetical protein